MTEPDLLAALTPVLEALRRLDVRHFVSGSIASSAHGIPRASIDADVVAELDPVHTAPLTAALAPAYYVPEGHVADAIDHRTSFNVIHLETMIKVDIFVSPDRPFDRRALDRATSIVLQEVGPIPLSSLEDTILAKLDWFRRGGEVSERQWSDVLGMLRTGNPPDIAYLLGGAEELDVAELLRRALDATNAERP